MDDELIGQRLRGYLITDYITAGATSRIYRATQEVLERDVAIKIPHFRYDDDGAVKRVSRTMTSRLLSEARILSQLEHPNVIPIHDAGQSTLKVLSALLKVPFYAMRFLSGGDLESRVQQVGGLDGEIVVALAGNLAEAIDYMHARNIIHRDIKPRDVLFDEFDIPYLANFAVALIRGEKDLEERPGHPVVMAPEVIADHAYSTASDVYAFGCCIFFALTAAFPYDSPDGNADDIMAAHVTNDIPAISTLNPDLPPLLDSVFARVLAKDPFERYDTATEFADALHDAYRYRGKSKKVFVSYNSRDLPTVTDLVQQLRAMGHLPWYDRELLESGGQHWWANILENIRGADAVLFVVSRTALTSYPCQLEIQYARDLNRIVVPVLIDPAVDMHTVPAWLASLQFINMTLPDSSLMLRVSLDKLPAAEPLPDPLPDAPPVPVSELSHLAERINVGDMETDDQLLVITKLELMLEDSTFAESALQLLRQLRARQDIHPQAMRKLVMVLAGYEA